MATSLFTAPADAAEPIHSGHFMTSKIHPPDAPGSSSDEEDVDVDVVGTADDGNDLAHNYSAHSVVKDPIEKPLTFYSFGPKKMQSIIIDDSLQQLKKCLVSAYDQLTTPKWKHFKGLRLNWKQRIRLNNVIWRAWYQEFGVRAKLAASNHRHFAIPVRPNQGKTKMAAFLIQTGRGPIPSGPVDTLQAFPKRYCYFSMPDDQAHSKFEGAILEGMYWKRRIEAVRAQYRRWRHFFMHRVYARHLNGNRLFQRHRLKKAATTYTAPLDLRRHSLQLEPTYLKQNDLLRLKDTSVVDMNGLSNACAQAGVSGTTLHASSSFDDTLEFDDWNNSLTDNLFDSLTKTGPYMFPDPREIATLTGNAQFIQPGLLTLQPSLEEILRSLDSNEPFPDAGPLSSGSGAMISSTVVQMPASSNADCNNAEPKAQTSADMQAPSAKMDSMQRQQLTNPYHSNVSYAQATTQYTAESAGQPSYNYDVYAVQPQKPPVASKGALKAYNQHQDETKRKAPPAPASAPGGKTPRTELVNLAPILTYNESSPSNSFTYPLPHQPIPIRPAAVYSTIASQLHSPDTQRGPADSTSASTSQSNTSPRTRSHKSDESSVSPATPVDRKRQQHLQAEQSRREALKEGFSRLTEHLPDAEQRHTNATILSMAADRIRALKSTADGTQLNQLKAQIAELKTKINNLQQALPTAPQAASSSDSPYNHLQMHARARSQQRSAAHVWLLWNLIREAITKCPVPTEQFNVNATLQRWAHENISVLALRAQVTNLLLQFASSQGGQVMSDPRALRAFIDAEAKKL